MKTNQLLSKVLASTMFAGMMIFGSSVLAQVKIGTSPATIGATSNLEVEATNNKKVVVNKADGTVIIENTPSGVSSDSILTINPSGLVRKVGSSTLKQNLGISGAFRVARTQSIQTLGSASNAVMIFDTETYDENNEMDPATGIFTASQNGTWLFQARENYSVNTGSNVVNLVIQFSTDGGVTWQNGSAKDLGPYAPGGGYLASDSYSNYLTAGTKVRVSTGTCNGCTTSSYPFSNQSLIGTRIR